MGLDTTIYFRAKPGFSSDQLENYLPAGFDVRPLPDYCADEYPDATHELDTGHRYYGEGYERGPWPHIAAALMVLFASECVERVWYGSDCSGPGEIKPEDVLKTSAYYMANGCRPYRGHFKANVQADPTEARPMSMESTRDEQRASVAVQRLVRVLGDLFRNPMPHDLIAIRLEVEREYGGDEDAAKEEMDAWCSREYMEQQIAAHCQAWHNAAEVLREYGPND